MRWFALRSRSVKSPSRLLDFYALGIVYFGVCEALMVALFLFIHGKERKEKIVLSRASKPLIVRS